MKELVDIIMPAHNPDGYIFEAIESCLSQSYKNTKLTVIDDHSDRDLGYLKERYPSINLIKTSSNVGPAGARNYGIKNTNGKYISFLDADDIMHKDKVYLSVREFENNSGIGMVCGNYQIFVNGRLRRPFYSKKIIINHSKLMKQNYVASGSVTIKRSVIEDIGLFDERFWIAEDYNCWVKVSEKYKIQYLPKVLYFYRILPGGNSLTQRNDIQKNHLKNLKIIKKESLERINAAKTAKNSN